MIYNCVRCGYETNHKGHFLNHLHRKKICRPILEDISIEDIKKHYNLENAKIHQNNPYEPKKTTYEPKKTQNNSFNCNSPLLQIIRKRYENLVFVFCKGYPKQSTVS